MKTEGASYVEMYELGEDVNERKYHLIDWVIAIANNKGIESTWEQVDLPSSLLHSWSRSQRVAVAIVDPAARLLRCLCGDLKSR